MWHKQCSLKIHQRVRRRSCRSLSYFYFFPCIACELWHRGWFTWVPSHLRSTRGDRESMEVGGLITSHGSQVLNCNYDTDVYMAIVVWRSGLGLVLRVGSSKQIIYHPTLNKSSCLQQREPHLEIVHIVFLFPCIACDLWLRGWFTWVPSHKFQLRHGCLHGKTCLEVRLGTCVESSVEQANN